MAQDRSLTGVERFFDDDEIIVSKTDLTGRITYANNVFLRLAGMTEAEAMGQPHSCIRNPEMPRAVFKLLWDTIQAGKEIFAYVVNRSKNGDHYWVLAHVTPSFDASGQVVGYHSNRRTPDRKVLETVIIPLYKQLLAIEKSHSNSKEGMNASFNTLVKLLKEKGVSYDEFIFSL
ncbi:MAG: PAS domain-containing protein [Alphaproteobacteria bacterium]|nr:PAS domain-containing protein [Alphaproteobacteria bacterium]MBF0251440.1 PAS domain-containing protein [Alphaproteobacteria bacterium]